MERKRESAKEKHSSSSKFTDTKVTPRLSTRDRREKFTTLPFALLRRRSYWRGCTARGRITLSKLIRLNRGDGYGAAVYIFMRPSTMASRRRVASSRNLAAAAGLRRRPLSPSPSSFSVHWRRLTRRRCPVSVNAELVAPTIKFQKDAPQKGAKSVLSALLRFWHPK